MPTSLASLLFAATDIAEVETVVEAAVASSLLAPGLLLLAFMVLGLIAVWGGVYLAMRWRAAMPNAASRKKTLLDRLAAAHGLSGDDVEQLRIVATHAAVADAAMVLIDPRVLETHAAKHPAALAWAAQMGERLFGEAYVAPRTTTPEPVHAGEAVGVG
jgi:hypothetical protein